MEEEIKNPELERIINQIDKDISNNPSRQKAAEIIKGGGGTLTFEGEVKDLCYFYTENGVKCFKFYENYKNVLPAKELEFIINHLKEEGYQLK